MATHTDTNALVPYNAQNFPNLGNPERFISNELAKIDTSIRTIVYVMRLMEARMNTNGLT